MYGANRVCIPTYVENARVDRLIGVIGVADDDVFVAAGMFDYGAVLVDEDFVAAVPAPVAAHFDDEHISWVRFALNHDLTVDYLIIIEIVTRFKRALHDGDFFG